MTTQELRELDAWIERFVFGTHIGLLDDIDSIDWNRVSFFSTDPAAAMDVLKKCAEKALIVDSHICIGNDNKQWEIWLNDNDGTQWHGEGETLELAIAKFSKALFSQTTK